MLWRMSRLKIPAIAAQFRNEHFISIKVDREERPDVDRVYMTYVQSLTGHGGWPLSAWLTPDLKPFYGGTYFPPEDRHGRPGFPSLPAGHRQRPGGMSGKNFWLKANASSTCYGSTPTKAPSLNLLPPMKARAWRRPPARRLSRASSISTKRTMRSTAVLAARQSFPRAASLNFLRCAALQGVDSGLGAEAVRMAVGTLQRMALGGIHDHVGGGFHRYSVDGDWFVPHFEKMLYDQAQIALNYLDAAPRDRR